MKKIRLVVETFTDTDVTVIVDHRGRHVNEIEWADCSASFVAEVVERWITDHYPLATLRFEKFRSNVQYFEEIA